MAAELADLEIGVLINNVGMCDNFCEPFSDIGSERVIDDLITCNVVSVPRMIHMLLPAMLARESGVIINIGSIAGAVSTPLGTLYGATKVTHAISCQKLKLLTFHLSLSLYNVGFCNKILARFGVRTERKWRHRPDSGARFRFDQYGQEQHQTGVVFFSSQR